ncbi:MAG: tRNA-dihydrouridine synthase, partial [Candidatus Dormibacteraeota bacterium]|nr:tRNA-dihydrouridine synthase [Candidatus Dormibacteraeota bacterium]
GWDHGSINAPGVARALQDVGVSAVAVHGRTRCQRYTGSSDWHEIARVKEAVSIPVIGSGDVDDAALIAERIRHGIVDGVVVARAMLGNLWFVHQAVRRVAGEAVVDQPFAERLRLTRRHLAMLIAYHGERRALRIGRKYVAWAVKGCAGAARLRALVQTLETPEQLDALFEQALTAGPGTDGWFQPVFTSGDG